MQIYAELQTRKLSGCESGSLIYVDINQFTVIKRSHILKQKSMRILRITFKKSNLTKQNKWVIVLKCTRKGLQKSISELKRYDQSPSLCSTSKLTLS